MHPRPWASVPLALALAALGVASCGTCASSSARRGDGDDGGKGVVVDLAPNPSQACTHFASAYCNRLDACAPFLLRVGYGDVVTCAERIAKGCMPGLTAEGNQATPSQMDSCAQAVEAETCDEAMDNPQPSACDVPGTLPVGATCGAGSQCATGYCRLNPGTICGTCTAHGGATAKCVVDADCAASLVCHLGTCMGPAPLGAPCGLEAPCLRTLACIGNKCQAPVPLGGACTAPTDCDSAHGGYCNLRTKVCEQTQTVAAGPCGLLGDGGATVVTCSGGASCGNLTRAGQGICHQAAADGSLCGPDINCLLPAICTSTARCTLPNPAFCH